MVSAINPEFSTYLLDKTIDIVEFNNINPIICVTKMDLIKDKEQVEKYLTYYEKIGYKVIYNTEKKELTDVLEGKVTVLIGQIQVSIMGRR